MYVATNDTDANIAFRDDAGKHIIEPGEHVVITGSQHIPAARTAGLSVDDIATPKAVARAGAANAPASVPRQRRRRKASVTVREE